MKKFPITIFYHYYIPADAKSIYWNWWLDEQLGIIQKSGVLNVADFKMSITMPRYWRNLDQYVFSDNFETKVKEYISNRYSFADILSFRDTGEENIYEGETLRHLHEHCKKTDGFVAYYHTKGVLSTSVETKLWRNLLDEIMINQWQMRYFDIQEYDCIGVLDGNPLVYSGNYFWAKNSYISKLPSPISTDRYFYENWINTNKPNRGVVINLKDRDMYNETLFYGNLDFSQYNIGK